MAGDDYLADPAIAAAARGLIPERGSGIDSITISTSGMGGESVTLRADDAERHHRNIDAALGRGRGGRTVNEDTGEVRDPGREAYRRKYLVLGTDPDAPIRLPEYGRVERPGGIPDYLRRAEATLLADIIDGLIERTGRYAPLADLQIACLWASDLGTVEGEPRLYRWKKPDDLTRWALGTGRPQRAYDLILEADGTVAARGQMTAWQAQALAHTAIDRVRVRSGRRIQVVPESALVQHFITARYGQWNAALMGIARALALAEREQLPLWDEADEDEGEGA